MHTEYQAPGGDRWRIENAGDLMQEFGLDEPEELPGWHHHLAGQGRMWEVVSRYYGVAPVLADPERARPRTPEEIAKEFSIAFAQVEREVDNAVAFWKSQQMASAIAESYQVEGDDGEVKQRAAAMGINRAFAQAQGLTEEDIDSILSSYSFDDLEDAVERRLVASRLIEFDAVLANPSTRMVGVGIIRQELDAHTLSQEITKLRGEIRNPGTKEGDRKAKNVQLRDLIKDRDKVLREVNTLVDKIAGDIGPSMEDRVLINDSVGFLVNAVRDYYADGSRLLIDGVHTAAEIDFMLEPVAERPCDYDPQAMVEIYFAQLGIFDKEFGQKTRRDGSRLNRSTSRRIRKIWQAALEELNEKSGVPVRSLEDPDHFDSDELEEELLKTATAGTAAVGEEAPNPGGVGEGSPVEQQEQAWRQAGNGGMTGGNNNVTACG